MGILFGILAVIVLIMLAVLAFTRNMSRPIIAIIVVLFLIVLGRAIG